MHRILAAAVIAAAAAPIALLGTAGAANAQGHSHISSVEPNGYNLILGTRANDTLFGTHGNDAMFGRKGDDRLITRGGDDVLFGNQGNDTLIDNGINFGPFVSHVVFHGGIGNDICIGTDEDTYLNCETVIIL